MNILFWYILKITTIYVASGCSSTPANKYQHKLVESPEMIVQIPNQDNMKILRDFKYALENVPMRPEKTYCDNLRPGLQQLTYGLHKDYFHYNHTDILPPMSKLFDFSCVYHVIDDMKFQKPDQIDSIRSVPAGIYQEYSKSFKTFYELVAKQHTMLGFWTSFVHSSESLSSIVNHSGVETTIISFVQHEFTAKLFSGITPGNNAQLQYKNLPDSYLGNENQYQDFITQYGSVYVANAVLGGRFFVCINHYEMTQEERISNANGHIIDLSLNVGQLVNTIAKKTKSHILSKFVLHQGGAMNFNENLGEWMKSIGNSPMIIAGTTLPLPYFFNETKGSKKFSAFMEASEQDHFFQDYKKMHSQLRQLTGSLYLAQKFMLIIEDEMKYIKPSPTVYNVISAWLKTQQPIHRYFFHCHKYYTKIGEHLYEQERQTYFVANGVCFTEEKGLPTCKEMVWELPNDVGRIRVFKSKFCTGASSLATTPEELIEVLKGKTSYMGII